MSETEVFYFSGTGNSLAVARDITQELGGSLTHVSVLQSVDTYKSRADTVGFVFPIYDFKAPSMVTQNIKKVAGLKDKYIFAVCTYGIAPKKSLEKFEETIVSANGQLSSSFSVLMPHNGIGSGALTDEQCKIMQDNWRTSRQDVCEAIKQRGGNAPIDIGGGSGMLRTLRMMPAALRFALRVATRGMDSLSLTADESCSGCGVCRDICPAHNIRIEGALPVWQDNCAGCFGCVHWCPKQAVSLGGFDANISYYHHPDVSIQDITKH